MPRPAVFVSYSHQDERWKDRLVQQLRVLEPEGDFEVWDDRRIAAGSDWFPEIEQAMQRAVAAVLISADFLTSPFILQAASSQESLPLLIRRLNNSNRADRGETRWSRQLSSSRPLTSAAAPRCS